MLVLDTVTGGDAERLYERAGWQRVGVVPDYALMPDGALCGRRFLQEGVRGRHSCSRSNRLVMSTCLFATGASPVMRPLFGFSADKAAMHAIFTVEHTPNRVLVKRSWTAAHSNEIYLTPCADVLFHLAWSFIFNHLALAIFRSQLDVKI